MSKLAIKGGNQEVTTPKPHFAWPPITEETRKAVLRQLDESISIYDRSGVFARFEEAFSQYTNTRHALLTNSGTAALHSLYAALGLKRGDEVICPAYTFHATVSPLLQTGATPILVDAGVDGNINTEQIKTKITSRTKAIMVTHMWGLPCSLDELVNIAQENGVPLLEDASHAHGARFQKRPVGSFGTAAVFSLQGQKTLTGGEGGVLVTSDDDLYQRAVAFGHYNKRCAQEISPEHPLRPYAVTGMGLKLRAHPLAIAIAEQQMQSLEKYIEGRERTAQIMIEELNGLPGLRLPNVPSDKQHSWYAFVMQYKPQELGGLPIEKFAEALAAEGCSEIDLPRSTKPLNLFPLYQSPQGAFPGYEGAFSYSPGQFPVAEDFARQAIKLPVWHEENSEPLVRAYLRAIRKVVLRHEELL